MLQNAWGWRGRAAVGEWETRAEARTGGGGERAARGQRTGPPAKAPADTGTPPPHPPWGPQPSSAEQVPLEKAGKQRQKDGRDGPSGGVRPGIKDPPFPLDHRLPPWYHLPSRTSRASCFSSLNLIFLFWKMGSYRVFFSLKYSRFITLC